MNAENRSPDALAATSGDVPRWAAAGARGTRWSRYLYGVIAAEVSAVSRYATRVLQCAPLAQDSGCLIERVEGPDGDVVARPEDLPDVSGDAADRSVVVLNGNLNYSTDIHDLLVRVRRRLSRHSRLVVVAYNPYLRGVYALANLLGLRRGSLPTTFVTRATLEALASNAGFEVVRLRNSGYFPFRWLGLGDLVNALVPAVPLLRWLGAVSVVTLRPVIPAAGRPSLSVLIPARNEKGNIENALRRMPDLGCRLEVIFVEGHSSDGTWEEIERVRAEWSDRFDIVALRQPGKGKNDAVRHGFAHASGDLLTILDADLTMPPEMLGRFYEAWREGAADFVNGSRLVYPMEGEAMRFLNLLGNIFFAKALSVVLGVRLGDSLCGTKLLARVDYERIGAWRADFGDFDPFGDFELLFPAAILGLGIRDVPIRYRARTYGSTQISRFRHGWQLLRMTAIGFVRVRTGRVRPVGRR